MNPFTKEKWVSALRSGEYKQGRGQLKRGCRYDTLGVLLEEAAPEFLSDDGYCDSNRTTLPDDLATLWGITESEQDTLVIMNDSQMRSFAYIADHIEREL